MGQPYPTGGTEYTVWKKNGESWDELETYDTYAEVIGYLGNLEPGDVVRVVEHRTLVEVGS